ncbi:MAG TPA: hypothetical protein VHZ97_09415 [Pseudonocardiaceae bacterium]|nr:hypothetical protein [Pseudonocardiaceae bacterium]
MGLRSGGFEDLAAERVAVAVAAVDGQPDDAGLVGDALDGGPGIVGQQPRGDLEDALVVAPGIAAGSSAPPGDGSPH